MFDKDLVLTLLSQIDDALDTIAQRVAQIRSADDFTDSPAGMEKLDGICMLFIAVGEALKNIDRITPVPRFFENIPKSTGKGPWVCEILSLIIILTSMPSRSSGYALMSWNLCLQ